MTHIHCENYAGNLVAERFSFLEASSPVQKTPLSYQKSILNCGDIFIIIKAIAQQGANWLIAWTFV